MTEEKTITLAAAESLAVRYCGWVEAAQRSELDDTSGIIVWGGLLLDALEATGSTVADPDTVRLTVRLAKEREADKKAKNSH